MKILNSQDNYNKMITILKENQKNAESKIKEHVKTCIEELESL